MADYPRIMEAITEPFVRQADVFLLCFSITCRESLEEVERQYARIAWSRNFDYPSEAGVSVVLVATKCDRESHRTVALQDAVEAARRMRASALFETSARADKNVTPLFDFAALYHAWTSRSFDLRRRLSTTPRWPWNWHRRYRWDRQLKQLQGVGVKPPRLAKSELEESVEDRIPDLHLLESRVFADLAALFDRADAADCPCPPDARVVLSGGDEEPGVSFPVHRIVLSIRSRYFRRCFSDPAVTTHEVRRGSGVSPESLRAVVRFCYGALLAMDTPAATLAELAEIGMVLFQVDGLADAVDALQHRQARDGAAASSSADADAAAPAPAAAAAAVAAPAVSLLRSSASIQAEMSHGLKRFRHLCDIMFSVVVEKKKKKKKKKKRKTFHLHRAILAARSQWFRALMSGALRGDWRPANTSSSSSSSSSSASASSAPPDEASGVVIEINSMTSEVFACVVEYLYTGRVENLTPQLCLEVLAAANELLLERLVQICERTLQPLISPDNVVGLCHASLFHNAHQLVEQCEHVLVREFETSVGCAAPAEQRADWEELPADLRERAMRRRAEYVAAKAERQRRQVETDRLFAEFRVMAFDEPEVSFDR